MQNKPLFFLHIPRTGGTTVDDILTKEFSSDSILKIYKNSDYQENRFKNFEDLKNIKYITGHLLLGKYDPPEIYDQPVLAFTFLREPVSRLVSEYIFYKTWPDQHLYKYIKEKKLSFKDYLLSAEDLLKYRGKNFMTRCISGKGFTYNKKSLSALAFAKRQLEKNFFFFGITELFNESILLLSQKLHLNYPLHEHHNKLQPKLKNEISESDIDLAKELNESDAELYNFAFELFKSRIDYLGQKFQDDLKKFIFLNQKYQNLANILNNNVDNIKDPLIYLPK